MRIGPGHRSGSVDRHRAERGTAGFARCTSIQVEAVLTTSAAAERPDSKFTWVFVATSGDTWGGTWIADSDHADEGAVFTRAAGTYTVLLEDEYEVDLSFLGLDDGEVFVEFYWDRQTEQFLPTRAGPGTPVGVAGLGSEFDFAWDGAAWQPFGLAGIQQADVPPQRRPGWLLLGGPGNDTFPGALLNDTLDGGTGYDVVAYDAALSSVARSRQGADVLVTARSDATRFDSIRQVEEIRFPDAKLHFSPDASAAQATRLYLSALGREPDRPGLEFWSGALDAGLPLRSAAAGFLGSPEFNSRYGALSDADYVERLYLNVLGRNSDPGGKQFWVGELARGQGRADILIGFSESAENRDRTAGLLATGLVDYDNTMAFVARLYRTTLDRDPDFAGAQFWSTSLATGMPISTAVMAFTASAEFQLRYGVTSNDVFVDLLYRNALDRPPDAGGFAFWTQALANGFPRADVVLGFSESVEHQTKLYATWQDAGIIFVG